MLQVIRGKTICSFTLNSALIKEILELKNKEPISDGQTETHSVKVPFWPDWTSTFCLQRLPGEWNFSLYISITLKIYLTTMQAPYTLPSIKYTWSMLQNFHYDYISGGIALGHITLHSVSVIFFPLHVFPWKLAKYYKDSTRWACRDLGSETYNFYSSFHNECAPENSGFSFLHVQHHQTSVH